MGDRQQGEQIAFVMQLRRRPLGEWQCRLHGAMGTRTFALPQAILTIRYWRETDSGLIRGTVQREGSDLTAPFQCTRNMEQLLRAWFVENDATP